MQKSLRLVIEILIICFLSLLNLNLNNLDQVAFPYANGIYDIRMFRILNTKIYCHRNKYYSRVR